MQFLPHIKFEGHSAAIYHLQFDGTYLYSASGDKFIARWDIAAQKQDQFSIKLPTSPYSIRLIDENQKLVVGLSSGDVHIFDLENRKEIKYIKLHQGGIFATQENKSKNQFYIADADGLLSVWDSKTLDLLLQLPFDAGKIRRIGLSLDENELFICGTDGFVRILDTNYFNLQHQFYAHEAGASSILVLEDCILTGGKDAFLRVWDKNNLTKLKEIPAHNYMIYDIVDLNETTFITASRDKTIKIWNKSSLKVTQRLDLKNKGHRHSVNCVITLDKTTFASASDDAKTIVWKKHQ